VLACCFIQNASTRNTDVILKQLADAPSELRLTIHNQFPGIELVSPVYATGRDVTCYLSPGQRVGAGAMMKASFDIDLTQHVSIGVLMYKLQRKSVGQSNKGAISNEEATCTQLVVIWKVNNSKKFCATSFLIEHDKRHVWDKNRLMRLTSYYQTINIHGPIEETYLMYGSTVLMTSLNATRKAECYKLEMTISKTSMKDDTQRLQYIDVER
jgi:hypothetical protein